MSKTILKRIIINADDLGYNDTVNSVIKKCLDDGVITSSTIMANGVGFDGVKSIVESHSNASFGVHLCLDEVKPLSKNEIFNRYGALDNDGVLKKGWYRQINFDKDLLHAIEDEWNLQVKRVKNEGIRISHLDSHHHCHTIPSLKSVLSKVARENDINKVRLNLYIPLITRIRLGKLSSPVQDSSSIRRTKFERIKNYITDYQQKKQEYKWLKKSFITTDFFISTNNFFNNMQLLYNFNNIELMCHPGHPLYEYETSLLYRDELKSIEKINYNKL